ncbi:MAG TPA: hypothetical protein VGL66_06495 [Caulobacteraceae bacterium]|jgi:hypothetical protein
MAERPTQFTDISATIATGGTAQTAAPFDSARKYLRIQNPWSATESLFINDAGANASASDGKSLELKPGAVYAPYPPPSTPISIVAATTGHAFEGKVGQ